MFSRVCDLFIPFRGDYSDFDYSDLSALFPYQSWFVSFLRGLMLKLPLACIFRWSWHISTMEAFSHTWFGIWLNSKRFHSCSAVSIHWAQLLKLYNARWEWSLNNGEKKFLLPDGGGFFLYLRCAGRHASKGGNYFSSHAWFLSTKKERTTGNKIHVLLIFCSLSPDSPKGLWLVSQNWLPPQLFPLEEEDCSVNHVLIL